MAKRAGEKAAGKERSKREEREKRILDAAIELLQKWGYRKTTLEDIAREAGVAKGTIYLYWPTREKLFMAIIEREQGKLMQEIARRMEGDPEGITLIGLVKHSILATLETPVMRALILQDTDFLGGLFIREFNAANAEAQLAGYIAILQRLREIGLIRTDIDVQDQALSTLTSSWGPLLINPLLPPKQRLSDERIASVVVTTLKRLLEPDTPPTAEQRRQGEQIFRAYMEQISISQLT
ncbi:MAG TPA: helix-turn-helix domain-containing protein [Ktedonobacteraceae bacterium]|nr:helix-turn-helix domain-containing protein [Ktedonobacteraceae bacterium]